MPFVEQEQYQISTRCRLHPDNDLFRDQEQHKIHMDINEWKCGYCKKSFRAEKFIDQHFENRHYNLLNIVCALASIFHFPMFSYFTSSLMSPFRNSIQNSVHIWDILNGFTIKIRDEDWHLSQTCLWGEEQFSHALIYLWIANSVG